MFIKIILILISFIYILYFIFYISILFLSARQSSYNNNNNANPTILPSSYTLLTRSSSLPNVYPSSMNSNNNYNTNINNNNNNNTNDNNDCQDMIIDNGDDDDENNVINKSNSNNDISISALSTIINELPIVSSSSTPIENHNDHNNMNSSLIDIAERDRILFVLQQLCDQLLVISRYLLKYILI